MPDHKELWNSVLVEMELSVSKPNFNTWFKDTNIVRHDDNTVYLAVPNAFVKEWLHNKYHNTILRHIRSIVPSVHSVEYIITREDSKKTETRREEMLIAPVQELPLSDYYINKEDNLNPRYTFESFIVGPFNELAHAASQAVIKKPGLTYNPLFIYGNTGHGKTHLIQAVGNHIKNLYKDKKVIYVTSEKFASDVIGGIQSGKIAQIKEKYRKYDVLIMDDIQFLSRTEKTQEELFHLFNTLFDNNKQIVFSSDKHPNLIPGIEDRLKGRFSAGMTVDIPAPDQDSRAAIIKAKTTQNNFSLSQEVIDFLALSIIGNIRDLEGVINLIICQSQLKGRELSLNEVKNTIKASAKPKKKINYF